MKFVLVFLTLVGVVCCAEDLLSKLKEMHNNPAYNHLSIEHKVMVSEMLAEGTVGELARYIRSIGVLKFLDLLLALPEHDTFELLKFTTQHLHAEKDHHLIHGS